MNLPRVIVSKMMDFLVTYRRDVIALQLGISDDAWRKSCKFVLYIICRIAFSRIRLAIAQLVERWTVEVKIILISIGHWFDSGSRDFCIFCARLIEAFD